MKTDLMNNVTRSFHKVGFKLKKHSPEILVVAGVVGTVASVVMACKATLKVHEVLDEAKETIDIIHNTAEEYEIKSVDAEDTTEIAYTQEDANKDLLIVYAQTGLKLVKLYGPAIAVGALGIGCMLASNNILRKRNVALAASLAGVMNDFKEYRGRVIERFGEKLDRELRYNIKAKEIEEHVVDEDGNETTVTKTVEVVDPNAAHGLYSVVFCEGNLGWTRNAELNKVFLIQQQNWANDRLKARGYLTLNEVYEAIGAQTTKYGQIAGWVWTEDSSVGDNYVDFGMFNVNNEKACDFVNGLEKSIILDFNCVGNILDYI
jgi:hypothetical protein